MPRQGPGRRHDLTPFVGRTTINPMVIAIEEAHDRALAPLGITMRQGLLLLYCAHGVANTPAALARLSAVEVSSVTRLADRLEKRGWIQRVRDARDRRSVALRVTPAGLSLLDKALPVATVVARQAWQGVSARELRVLRAIVGKVLRNLGAEGPPE
jgi:MarR family transcriptional regulator, organic hydroperoxide resistance regulator